MNDPQHKLPLLVIVGPTAVGKTKFSLDIALQWNGEIISGDSMQVYRGMDIGTAKASKQEQERVPHHLLDIREPEQSFSVAEFQARATQSINELHAKGKLPVLVGGTGLYIESVCYQYQFAFVGSDEFFRKERDAFAEQHGDEALHHQLIAVDPQSAQRLHPHDRRRIIRSLEIAHVSGSTHSALLAQQTKTSPYQLCLIGLTMERSLLYERVEQRIDEMLHAGLIAEVKSLLDTGCPRDAGSMQALGYKEMVGYLDQVYSYEQAVEVLKTRTRHYVKRQLSWFRHMKEINWIDVSDSTNSTIHFQLINDIISTKFNHKFNITD